MKTKLLLACVLVLLRLGIFAQALTLGEGVVTESATLASENVVKIYSIANPSGVTMDGIGSNMGIPDQTSTNWTAANLGQVFGVAINTNTGHVYVSATQIYRSTSICTGVGTCGYNNQYQEFAYLLSGSTTFANGTPLIWELDPVTGSATAIVTSTSTENLTFNNQPSIFNLGTALGNLCYDSKHHQIFATDMEDGRIYRIDASGGATNGQVLSRYDPFTSFHSTYTVTGMTKFADLGERLWGIAYKFDKVYFARWVEDDRHTSPGVNEIYSVNINDATGDFASGTLSGGTYEYLETSPTGVITALAGNAIPPITTDGTNYYSNPVSDIKISADGTTMLLAERTMGGPYDDGGSTGYWAHSARVLRYDLSVGWIRTAPTTGLTYHIGNSVSYPAYPNSNSAGGVDFGYNDTLASPCEKLVWVTGDALEYPGGSWPGNYDHIHSTSTEYVYGLAGIPISGNTAWDPTWSSGAFPNSVNLTTYYQDIFTSALHGEGSGVNKRHVGDIAIYRDPCSCFKASINPKASCGTSCNGAASVTTTGGAPTYHYIWSNGSTNAIDSNLCLGVFSVTVTDSNGCVAADTVIIGPELTLALAGINCTDSCNGAVDLIATGPYMPFSYLWNTGARTVDITGLCSGTYAVTVTDSLGCSVTGSAGFNCNSNCTLDSPGVNCIKCYQIDSQHISHFISVHFNYGGSNGSHLILHTSHNDLASGVNQYVHHGLNNLLVVIQPPTIGTYTTDSILITVVDSLTGDTCNIWIGVNLICDSTGGFFESCVPGMISFSVSHVAGLGIDPHTGLPEYAVYVNVNNTSGGGLVAVALTSPTGNRFWEYGGYHLPGLSFDTILVWGTDTLLDTACIDYFVFAPDLCPICTSSVCTPLVPGCSIEGYFYVSEDTICTTDSITVYFGGGIFYHFFLDGADSGIIEGALSNVVRVAPHFTPGLHHIQWVIGGDSSFRCSDTVNVYVYSYNCCQGKLALNDTAFCYGDTICFTISGGNTYGLYIDTLDLQHEIFSGATPFSFCHVINNNGDVTTGYHHFMLVIYGADSLCTDTITRTFYIRPACACSGIPDTCPAMVANFTYTSYPGYAVFRDVSTGDPTYVEWYVGGQSFVTGPGDSLRYTFAHSGSFNVCLTIHHLIYGSDICCIKDTCLCIGGSVDTCDLLNLHADFSYNQDLSVPYTYNFFPMGSSSPGVVIWNFGDSVSVYSDSSGRVTHTFDTSGCYDVCISEIWLLPGNYCCIDSQCYKICVEPIYAMMSVHPNPVRQSATFKFKVAKPGVIDLTLFNAIGNKTNVLINAEFYKGGYYEKEYDLGQLPAGVYNYLYKSADGVFTGKVVKQ